MRSPGGNAYQPDRVSLPGETLQEVLEDRQMSQADFADRTGRPRKTINEIIHGKTAITPETALQFERVLGIPASFWNNLERNYQEYLARQQETQLLEASTDWLRQIPIKDLAKLGWIQRHGAAADQVREVLRFFGIASPAQWDSVSLASQASFRHSPSFASHQGALAAWLRKGELEAQKIDCESYDRAKFRRALAEARRLTVEDPEIFVPRLIALCAAAGVAVAFVHELPKCRVHGATRWLSSDKALIQLSLRYKTNDHLWFTFFHEAGHILLHGKKETFIEVGDKNSSTEEAEANRFAADFLIPIVELERFQRSTATRSEAAVRRFAGELGIAPGIVVGRLQHDGWLPPSHLNGLKLQLRWYE